MTTLRNKLMILCVLGLASGALSADPRFDSRAPYSYDPAPRAFYTDIASFDWRLGDARRGGGREILYRVPGSRRWQVAPGEATALADGWVLGTDRHRGGFGIYRWNGRGWSRMPGEAVQIGGSYSRPWVVNATGTRFTWDGREWREEASRLRPGRDRDGRRDAFRR